MSFLRTTAYPLLKEVGAFYQAYMTQQDGLYHVMHSCAMEVCSSQGPMTSGAIALSNNPPFDLAFVKRTFRQLLVYSQILGVDADLQAGWKDILARLVPYQLTRTEDGRTVFAQASLRPVPYSFNVTDGFPNQTHCTALTGDSGDTSGCGNARYPIVFFNAMHPGEDIDLESDPELVTIGRTTVDVVNAINDYSPTNGLCMAWPPASRIVNDTSALLGRFTKALQDTMMPNFVPFIYNRPTGGSGCNMENSGTTVAVNDLLASVHGHAPPVLRLWPGGWLANQSVSFETLRVKGAFLVSGTAQADSMGTILYGTPAVGIKVVSLQGNDLVFRWESTPQVKDQGVGLVPVVQLAPDTYRLTTQSGHAYLVQ